MPHHSSGPQLRTRIQVCAMVGPLKNIYIYRTTPVTWTLKGNKKQFEGRFQWNLDEGNRNLVQVSKELKLSEFKLSGFFCIIIIIIQLANQIEKFSDMLSPEVCALADYTSQPWCLHCRQVISVQLKSSQFILQRVVKQTPLQWSLIITNTGTRDTFLETHRNFMGPTSNVQIKI